MSNKFLGGTSSDLTNGTANLYIASLSIDGLDPSKALKTNTTKTLESSNLDIADVNQLQVELNSKLSNPMTQDLDFQSFAANDINDVEFNKLPNLAASTAGTLRLYANDDGEMHQVDEFGNDTVIGGDTFDQDLNTTDDVIFNKATSSTSVNFQNAGGGLIWDAGSNQYVAEVSAGNIHIKADNAITLDNDTTITGNLTCGLGATNFTLPDTRGTAGQVLKDVAGNGIVSWETDEASGNPFSELVIDNPSEAILTLEKASDPKWTVRNTSTVANELSIRNATGAEALRINQAKNINLFGTITQNSNIFTMASPDICSFNLTRGGSIYQNSIYMSGGGLPIIRIGQKANEGALSISSNSQDLLILDGPTKKTTLTTSGSSSVNTQAIQLELKNDTNGTPLVGCGSLINFNQEVQDGVFADIAQIGTLLQSVGAGSENASLTFKNMKNGVLLENYRLAPDGLITFNGTYGNFSGYLSCNSGTDKIKLPLNRGVDGQVMTTNGAGDTFWESKPFGENYFVGNATGTIINVVNVYAIIIGVRLASALVDFTSSGVNLTYTGARTRYFKLSFSGEWQTVGVLAQNYQIGFHKNGVLIPSGQMTGKLDNSAAVYPRNISTTTIVELAQNDVIDIRVRNLVSTQDVLFPSLIMSAVAC
jgi:hypothetical protein